MIGRFGAFTLLLLLSGAAHSQSLSLSLDFGVQTGAPGDTVTFVATLTNTDPTAPLTGFTSTLQLYSPDAGYLTPASLSLPGSLAPAGNAGDFWTGPVFSYTIGAAAPAEDYLGSFQIDYQNQVTGPQSPEQQYFLVTVASTPEPGIATLLAASSLCGMSRFLLRRKTPNSTR